MIEEIYVNLLNYGVLGLWTLTLVIERIRTRNKLEIVIENNTKMLSSIGEIMKLCNKR